MKYSEEIREKLIDNLKYAYYERDSSYLNSYNIEKLYLDLFRPLELIGRIVDIDLEFELPKFNSIIKLLTIKLKDKNDRNFDMTLRVNNFNNSKFSSYMTFNKHGNQETKFTEEGLPHLELIELLVEAMQHIPTNVLHN